MTPLMPSLALIYGRSARIGLLILCVLGVACERDDARMRQFSGSTMGTFYSVKVMDLPAGLRHEALDRDIDRLLGEVDSMMSTYRDDSQLSRFNAADSTDWFPVSPETVEVVNEALEVSRMTQGAFDITVGPLVNLWGFGPGAHEDRIPSDQAIADLMVYVGYRHLYARNQPPALRKTLPGIYIDLSAVAKGYAVDKVARHLESLGVVDYMVEVGGELRLKGNNAQGRPWRIAIERPMAQGRAIYRVIAVRDKGVATSGDYRNYFEVNGKRFSHTIDPRTGRPIDHRLASVTVIADSAMHADALATALMVIGTEAGYELAQRHGLAAYFISKLQGGFSARATSMFAKYLVPQE
jgi:thiamine biosynthesis lipoprotein